MPTEGNMVRVGNGFPGTERTRGLCPRKDWPGDRLCAQSIVGKILGVRRFLKGRDALLTDLSYLGLGCRQGMIGGE